MLSCNSRLTVFSRLIILAGVAFPPSPPDARIVPSVLSTVTWSTVMPGTAAATRWRIAGADEKSLADSVRMITEAEGGWRLRRKEPFSGDQLQVRLRADAH